MREDWVECTFNELVVDPKKDFVDGPFGSNLKSEEYKQSGIPVLRIQNIKANRFI
ncbi:restriction endonuclease subunit S, partial [Chryseobacterium sp. HMWF028]